MFLKKKCLGSLFQSDQNTTNCATWRTKCRKSILHFSEIESSRKKKKELVIKIAEPLAILTMEWEFGNEGILSFRNAGNQACLIVEPRCSPSNKGSCTINNSIFFYFKLMAHVVYEVIKFCKLESPGTENHLELICYESISDFFCWEWHWHWPPVVSRV